MVVEHTSIEGCRQNWTGTGESPVAGQAMSKAIRVVGLSLNPTGSSRRISINCGWDSYNLAVPASRSDEVVAELRKDRRVTRIDVDGVEVPKQKTVEELEAELAAFKKKVFEVASRTKRQEDWCDEGFANAMVELGIETPKKKARVVLELEVPEDVDLDDFDSVKSYIQRDVLWDEIYGSMKTVEPVEG